MEDCREYLMNWTISIYLIVELDLTSLYYLKDPTSGGQVFHKTGETCSFKVKKKKKTVKSCSSANKSCSDSHLVDQSTSK